MVHVQWPTLSTVRPTVSVSEVVAVLVGGMAGTAARLGLDRWIPHESHELPVSTLLINLVGSFLLGLLLGAPLPRMSADLRLALTTGVLGTFTTLSALALSTVLLVDGGRAGTAALYVAVSLVAGLTAAGAGLALGGRATRRGGAA